MPDPPRTDEGYFVLHDFRRIDWDAWREAPDRRRQEALDAGRSYLEERTDLESGETAIFTIAGHKADLLVFHLRPTLDEVERAERTFDGTDFASFTEQSDSYVSVTEIGGYTAPEYFEDPESVDAGVRRYMQTKQYPTVPTDVYLSFYPMSKRRDPTYNWYELPFEERAEMMEEHGETGKDYAGSVTQIVSSSMGFDDWEWGVTLFGTEATHLKDIVYDMRFDEATSKYAEFGRFYTGRRFPPSDLAAYMAGESVPTGEAEPSLGHGRGERGDESETDDEGAEPVRDALADLDVYAGQPHGEDVYALALYSDADVDTLAEEVDGLRSNFDHYDTHVTTAVYENRGNGPAAVVSIWETESAADTASGFLADLPDVVGRGTGAEEGWGTMGMFYTVKPEHREDFLDTFDDVVDALEGMSGHRDTSLLVNRRDENDMFIASRWDSREDAMSFFRSDEFAETVSWGRDVLVDRPRHVFLA
ncbi:MAG: heme-binding protein [Halodesulfurarchaeum sp.]